MHGTEPARYRAFISYSHRDAAFGRGLHRRLEAYRLPRRLVGRTTARGPAPARLSPIFRDREELAAADDLSVEVRAALAASGALIVVCSPHAFGSAWVSREVELFRELHPGRPVLAALIDGEPGEAFPEALRRPGLDGRTVEPLAADFRKIGDGPRLALLKLVAGVAGVGLDELVQRDAQRRLRGVMAVTAASLALTVGMGALAAFALQARGEAERQRAEAEGLVEFMLTDLRDRLEGVGRLDVLTAVNQRALAHYEGQDLDGLPAESLERRARILHAMGEDDEKRGDLDRALAQFREAQRTTAALLAADPDNSERLWAHGQSEYWVGYIDYRRGRYAAAKPAFLKYKRLSDRLVAIEPQNPKYLREAGYADGNLCTIALRPPRDVSAALLACSTALERMEAAHRLEPDPDVLEDVVNRHAWLADAHRANGDTAAARSERLRQEQLLGTLMAGDPQNMELKYAWIVVQRTLAALDRDVGQADAARTRLVSAQPVMQSLVRFEPKNQQWLRQHRLLADDLAGRTTRSHETEGDSDG